MINYKLEAARACLPLIRKNQTIGLGAGSTMSHLADCIAADPDLSASLTLVSSSFKTRLYLLQKGFNVKLAPQISQLDFYFDGCDCFDHQLNALKSGGGIHTQEKILAVMAGEFILVGDESKLVAHLDHQYPLVLEILPDALPMVEKVIRKMYPETTFTLRMSSRSDGAAMTVNGNFLADLLFPLFPDLALLNTSVKMIPGVLDHSLFYQLATSAVVAGTAGVSIMKRV
jgi:ribose 5-phosphate isomerase A